MAHSDMATESGLVKALDRDRGVLGSLSSPMSSSDSSMMLYCGFDSFLNLGSVSSMNRMLMMVVRTPRQAVNAQGSRKGLHDVTSHKLPHSSPNI